MKFQQSSVGELNSIGSTFKNGAKNAATGESSALERERQWQTHWSIGLTAFDGVGVKCFAIDSMILELCRLESNTSFLMS